MQKIITVNTTKYNQLIDLTDKIRMIVNNANIKNGMVNIYVQGATAAIMIQENWDDSVQNDVVELLNKLIPNGVWEHDQQDGNGDAHLKSGIVGPSESVPIINGELALSTRQNIFLCEFDGPRETRNIVVTILSI